MFRYLNPVLKRNKSTAIHLGLNKPLPLMGIRNDLCVVYYIIQPDIQTNSWAWSMIHRRSEEMTKNARLSSEDGVWCAFVNYRTKGPDHLGENGEMGSRLGFSLQYLRHGIDRQHSSSI